MEFSWVEFSDHARRQMGRDHPIAKRNWDIMLREANKVSRARLLATEQKDSGAWLNALKVSSLGTLLHS